MIATEATIPVEQPDGSVLQYPIVEIDGRPDREWILTNPARKSESRVVFAYGCVWQCDCKDWTFQGRKHRGGNHPCKHIGAVLKMLNPPEPNHEDLSRLQVSGGGSDPLPDPEMAGLVEVPEVRITPSTEPDSRARSAEVSDSADPPGARDCGPGGLSLLPCPFCGCVPEVEEIVEGEQWYVVCRTHRCVMGMTRNSKEEAIEHWNRRTT